MSQNLNSIQGVNCLQAVVLGIIWGTTYYSVVKGDARSLDAGSYGIAVPLQFVIRHKMGDPLTCLRTPKSGPPLFKTTMPPAGISKLSPIHGFEHRAWDEMSPKFV